jgi:putative tryptophan/tyrosine transport system substrate-binding protein
MRRREFVTLLAGAAVTLRSAQSYAQPQPSKIYRMGYLAAARIPHLIEALQEGLRKFGYIEDQNLKIEYRFAQGGTATLDVLAAELVRLSPDVIIILGTPAVIAVKQATKTIPIVMAGVGDPLGSGIVTSLAHPDGNVTGVALFGAELAGKRVAVFKEAVPGLGSVGVLGNATNLLNTKLLWPQTQAGARSLGLEARLFTVREAAELSEAFDDMARDHAGGLVVLSDALLNSERRTIIGLAAQHRLAAMYEGREFVADGGLLSYGPNLSEMIRRAGGFIDKILKGAKPADLPIEQPTEFELVINLKTAKLLSLTIADKILAVADKVIE